MSVERDKLERKKEMTVLSQCQGRMGSEQKISSGNGEKGRKISEHQLQPPPPTLWV